MARRHTGFGLSIDQKVTDEVTVFGRYGHHTAGRVRFDRALTLGTELDGSGWGRGADAVGAALAALRTSARYHADSLTTAAYEAGGQEQHAELYYRYKLNNKVEISPDFQYIRRPGGNGAADPVKIIGLRAKVGI